MIEIKVDTSKLERAISEYARETRKDVDEVMRQQAGILVGHVMAMTPPGDIKGQGYNDRGGISQTARKQGESRIAADIARIFPTTDQRKGKVLGWIRAGIKVELPGKERSAKVHGVAFTDAELERLHKQARSSSTGRTRVRGNVVHYTREQLRKRLIKKQIKRVGLLNAGWLKAARELKTATRNMPAWITRHGEKGGTASVTGTKSGTVIRIGNTQAWFPDNMARRVKYALDRREHSLRKEIIRVLAKNAKRANRRQSG